MSQNDFTIANQGFPAFRADLNSALQALASNSSGTSAPSTTFANMWWYDSTNNIMYIRNEDNDAWIKFAELDQTNDKFVLSGTLQLDDGTVSAPALTFNSDTNMGIYRGGTDILKFVTAGTDRLTIDANGNVGIANSSPATLGNSSADDLVVGTTSGDKGITVVSGTSGTGRIAFADSGDTLSGRIVYDHNTNNMSFGVAGTASNITLNSSGNLGLGMSSPSQKLDVRGTVHLGVSGTSSGDVTGTLSIGNTGTNYMTLIKAINTASTPAILKTRMGFFTLSGVGEEASHATEKVSILADSGNTGIGTTVPAEKLSVNGNMRLQTGNNPARIQYLNSTSAYSVGSSGGASISFHDVSGSQEISFETHHVGSSHAERVRISKEGNLLVGQTSQAYGTVGASITPTGQLGGTANGDSSLILNRTSSNGTIAQFRKDNTVVGTIGNGTGRFSINGTNGSTGSGIQFDINAWLPKTHSSILTDNTIDLGSGTFRFDDIFATNGTIQTSDRNEKQDIEELSDAEQRVAVVAKGLMKKFRWKDKVAEKGDNARTHFGIIAQDLQDAFTAEGLDANDYAMFCSNTWTDDDGNEQTRLGVRYNQLLAFIISAI